MDRTTTTDSLGIVTLAIAAFKRGRIDQEQLLAINDCADAFTQALSLANKYRELTGESLALDDFPSPTGLRRYLELDDFAAALREAAAIQAHMKMLFQAVKQRLNALGLRTDQGIAG